MVDGLSVAYSAIETASALLVFLAALIAAKAVDFAIKRTAARLTKKSRADLENTVLLAFGRVLASGIIILGFFMALYSLSFLKPYEQSIFRAGVLVAIVWAVFAARKIIDTLLAWYMKELSSRLRSKVDESYISIFRKILFAAIYAVAVMVALSFFGVEITPLIATFGIGALAIALALQESLSNFFSGFYLVSDKTIKVGDFIELEQNLRGYVHDIGWRSTKIRTLSNNIIVIPNNKLASSVVTDYHTPQPEMNIWVDVGVSYASDLERVERVTLEAARKVQQTVEGAIRSHEPMVRYSAFGDSNIQFNVILRVKSYADQFPVKHAFVKALKRAYDEAGIEISYPSSNIYFKTPIPTLFQTKISSRGEPPESNAPKKP